jgi:hypothetical protein
VRAASTATFARRRHLRPAVADADDGGVIGRESNSGEPIAWLGDLVHGSGGLSAQADPGAGSGSARRVAALVVANSSLLVAALLYMGWAYTDALWGYFHLDPLNLGVGVVEYVLRSLSLFSPVIVVAAVAFIAIAAVWTWDLDLSKYTANAGKLMEQVMGRFPRLASSAATRQLRTSRGLLITAGMATTLTGLSLAGLATSVPISTYLILGFLGAGPLVLTWPTRAQRHGRSLYALAAVVAAVCGLWAGSLYAHNQGIRAAQNVVNGLAAGTAVAVYSTQRLALSGPGVTVEDLGTAFGYPYEYEGLRLLTVRSGTYYLLPVGWTPRQDLTYILADSDQIRIELYSGQGRPAG